MQSSNLQRVVHVAWIFNDIGAAKITSDLTAPQVDAIWAQFQVRHTYDAAGRRLTTTDAYGNTTRFFYDQDGRLNFTVNAAGDVVAYTFNTFGQLSVEFTARLGTAALQALALIVRGADTNRLELAPQSAGLAAISLGLSILHEEDLQMLERGILIYDALYTWCREGKEEVHTWNPAAYR